MSAVGSVIDRRLRRRAPDEHGRRDAERDAAYAVGATI